MKKRLVILILAIFVVLPQSAAARSVVTDSATLKSEANSDQDFDSRQFILKAFFRKKDSFLTDYTKEFIQTADKNNLDWRLLPAIAGLESGFGKRLAKGSFNPFGWGGGYFCFDSWPAGIDCVGKALGEKPYPRELTPEAIGPIYAPPNHHWGGLVQNIMNQIVALP